MFFLKTQSGFVMNKFWTIILLFNLVGCASMFGEGQQFISIETSTGDKAKAFNAAEVFKSKINEFKQAQEEKEKALSEKIKEHTKGSTKTESGLQYIIIKEGKGEKPHKGDTVSLHYSGFLTDGTMFDSSYERNQPFEFVLGTGRVIKGWDEGVALLNQGAKAKFIIPSNLAYGSRGAGGVIPPNATLIFEVELLDIKHTHDHSDPNHTH